MASEQRFENLTKGDNATMSPIDRAAGTVNRTFGRMHKGVNISSMSNWIITVHVLPHFILLLDF